MIVAFGRAQITLENSYPSNHQYFNMYVVNLGVSGYKYYSVDPNNKILRIYNLNHSLWKSINILVPTGYNFGIYNISETLFNTDNSVEVAYCTHTISMNPFTINYEGRVMSETGSLIKVIPNCASMQVYNTGSNGFKLFATIDSVGKTSVKNVEVYSLVGSLPSALTVNEISQDEITSSLYPNPSSERVRIDYELPSGTSTGEVILCDLNGAELKRYQVDRSFSSLDLNNQDLPSGTYFYKINAGSSSSTMKMVVIK